MRHAPDIFLRAVVDALVVVPVLQDIVDRRLVGVDLRSKLRVLGHEAGDMNPVGVLNVAHRNLLRLAILHANNRLFADRATARSGQLGALGVRHVLPAPADVRLVGLYRTTERLAAIIAVINIERLADALKHEPCRRLPHANIAAQTSRSIRLSAKSGAGKSPKPICGS